MAARTPKSGNTPDVKTTANPNPTTNLANAMPVVNQLASTVEQNVKPAMTEAQRVAAQTSVSGRKAVSRGTMFLAFYAWLLSGALMLSWIARRTQFFPGDMPITKAL